MKHVVLSLGSNIQRELNIRKAVHSITKLYGNLDISPIYETSPVGFKGPNFLNFIVGLYSFKLLDSIKNKLYEIEVSAGRIKGGGLGLNRVLDIDILLFGEKNLRHQGVNIPRDDIEKYAYVLKPLTDLYPNKIHPINGLTMKQIWKKFQKDDQKLTVFKWSL